MHRCPLLVFLTAFTLILIAIFECLSRRSLRDGGIVFAGHGFTKFTVFTYFYLPTIIAVMYSMSWAWIALDTERLEPYFQMSKFKGASPGHSVFLHYPFDLELVPPLKALQLRYAAIFLTGSITDENHRHWSVVIAWFVSTIVFCGITPLSGAVFESVKVTRLVTTSANYTAHLLPAAEQSSSLIAGSWLNAYSILWLNQKLPSFTSRAAAFVPFEMDPQPQTAFSDYTWTAPTTMYSSSLDCQPAFISNDSYGVTYDNRKGCVVRQYEIDAQIPNSTSIFSSYYQADCCGSGSGSKAMIAFSFKNKEPPQDRKPLPQQGLCFGPDSTNNGTPWASYWDKTVLICEPSYFIQSVNVTVTVPNMTVSNFNPLESPQQLLSTTFDISMFESLVVGTSPDPNRQQFTATAPKKDINETTNIDTTQLTNRGLTDVFDHLIVFAVGFSQLAADAYLNASVLATSMDYAYQILFALAVTSLLSPGTMEPEPTLTRITGEVRGDESGIVVVRSLALALEACLGVAALSTSLLLLIYWNRRSELQKDPASLSRVMEMIQNEPKLPMHIEKLGQTVSKPSLTLKSGQLQVERCGSGHPLISTYSKSSTPQLDKETANKSVLPLVMSNIVGFSFLGILITVLVIVVALHLCIRHLHGLNTPTNNPILAQIILNYVPVLFATLLEPFWTLLNRRLCLMKPIEALRSGESRAYSSLDLRYTSLPPQLSIWRALKARHFLLVAVCAIGLSSNILAVVLNALLQPQLTTIATNGTFLESFSLSVNDSPSDSIGSDHLYFTAANFSHGTSLPAWVSQYLYFLPFQINTTSPVGSVQSYSATTPGLGLDVVCTNQTWADPAYIALPDNNIGQPQISVSQSNVSCTRQWDTFYDSRGKTNATLEILAPLAPSFANASHSDRDICGSTLAIGFLRAELYPEVEGVDSLFTSSTWMTCEFTLFTAMYEVQVTTSGRVEDYSRKSDKSKAIPFLGNSSVPSFLNNLFVAFDAPFNNLNPYWSNDTTRDTWPGFLIKAITKSPKLIDPALPAPDFEIVAPIVIDLIRRVFPIVLGLRPSAFVPAPQGSKIEGKMLISCTRIFMSSPLFIATVTLLLLNIAVGVAYYICRPQPLPRSVLEETIAGVLKLFDGSGLVKEQVKDKPWPKDWRFGYGGFIGVDDGKPRMGIERRPFVVPLDAKKGV